MATVVASSSPENFRQLRRPKSSRGNVRHARRQDIAQCLTDHHYESESDDGYDYEHDAYALESQNDPNVVLTVFSETIWIQQQDRSLVPTTNMKCVYNYDPEYEMCLRQEMEKEALSRSRMGAPFWDDFMSQQMDMVAGWAGWEDEDDSDEWSEEMVARWATHEDDQAD